MRSSGRARADIRRATYVRPRLSAQARAERCNARRGARGIVAPGRRSLPSAQRIDWPARIAWRFEKKTAADRIAVCSVNIPATVKARRWQ
jgi:hypothetical protein